MLSAQEIKAFFEGAASTNTGIIRLATTNENNIARINFGVNDTSEIIMTNGDRYYISNVVFNNSHQIISLVITHDGVSKQCNMTYDENGYLTKVGNIRVSNVQSLNLSDLLLQTKTVNPNQSVQEITADAGYVGLSKVTVNPGGGGQTEPKIVVKTSDFVLVGGHTSIEVTDVHINSNAYVGG